MEGEKGMDCMDIIGLTAGAMGGFSLLPQVIKVLKTKSTKDISREMFLLLASSIFLWLIYGLFLNNFPIIIANFFGLIQALIILYFKIENQIKKRSFDIKNPL
jgi:MtN3 and saliva related transmembrane protein